MYTLLGICGCCGDPSLIMKSDNINELDNKKEEIEAEIKKWEEENAGQELYESLGATSHLDVFSRMMQIVEEDPEQENLMEGLSLMLGKIAPKHFGLELHIL